MSQLLQDKHRRPKLTCTQYALWREQISIRRIIDMHSMRNRLILINRSGYFGPVVSLAKLAQELDLSTTRIGQIEMNVVRRLQMFGTVKKQLLPHDRLIHTRADAQTYFVGEIIRQLTKQYVKPKVIIEEGKTYMIHSPTFGFQKVRIVRDPICLDQHKNPGFYRWRRMW